MVAALAAYGALSDHNPAPDDNPAAELARFAAGMNRSLTH